MTTNPHCRTPVAVKTNVATGRVGTLLGQPMLNSDASGNRKSLLGRAVYWARRSGKNGQVPDPKTRGEAGKKGGEQEYRG